ncbi:MAG: DUF1345 domain-containing protein [Alphaproteobacteria bacterium]|nr:DUF1345 domain-containing protein [Alphaproteobacteria bacterium]
MTLEPIRHLRRHRRFYGAAALGIAVTAAMLLARVPMAAAAGGDAFFAAYLAASAYLLLNSTAADVKACAITEDEGITIVIAITLLAVTINMANIFVMLNQHQRPDSLSLTLGLAAAPLGWFMLHTISAFHYADLHYSSAGEALDFPGTDEPDLWDFFYFSFVIGMTAQVSDVPVCTSAMRRAVIGHSIVSFFFNTVLIALAVNAAVASAS